MILLAVGVWGKVSLEKYLVLAAEQSTNAPYVLIGTGACIIVFGLFGCFATCRGSPWMLKLVSVVHGSCDITSYPSSVLWTSPSDLIFWCCLIVSSVCHVPDIGVLG